MDFNNYWTRTPAQISYPEPYRMAQPRMAEPRFPSNTIYTRGVVDFSNYHNQPPLPLPPNLKYSHQQQCLRSNYATNERDYPYQTQSKWDDSEPTSFRHFDLIDRPKHDLRKTYSFQLPEQIGLISQQKLVNQPGNGQGNANNNSNKHYWNYEKVTADGKAGLGPRILGIDGPPPKARRVNNPPMPMLPPPKIKVGTKKLGEKATEQKSYESTTQKATFPTAPALCKTRIMAGSIQQLLKWNSVLHKTPPLYETAGQLTTPRPPTGRCINEYCFGLRNLFEWHKDEWGSVANLLDCIVYAEPDTFALPSTGTIVRVVGRFQPSGLFQCLKVRHVNQRDLQYLKTKLGLLNQNKRTSCSYNNSANSANSHFVGL